MTREGPVETVLDLMRDAVEECLAVGQKSGAKVPDSWVDDRMTFSDNAPPGMKASMLHDLEAGNRLELDWLTGKVVELGKQTGVPTPAAEAERPSFAVPLINSRRLIFFATKASKRPFSFSNIPIPPFGCGVFSC